MKATLAPPKPLQPATDISDKITVSPKKIPDKTGWKVRPENELTQNGKKPKIVGD